MEPTRAFRGAMAEALDSATGRTTIPSSVADIVKLFGGGSAGLSSLAQALSGSQDRTSKAYKAARRNLERYTAPEGKQRRTPSKDTREKLAKLAEGKVNSDALAQMAARGVRVTVSGRVLVSPGGKRSDERERDIDVVIAPEDVKPFTDEYAARHFSDAFTEFSASFFDAWGIGPAAIFTDISALDITIN